MCASSFPYHYIHHRTILTGNEKGKSFQSGEVRKLMQAWAEEIYTHTHIWAHRQTHRALEQSIYTHKWGESNIVHHETQELFLVLEISSLCISGKLGVKRRGAEVSFLRGSKCSKQSAFSQIDSDFLLAMTEEEPVGDCGACAKPAQLRCHLAIASWNSVTWSYHNGDDLVLMCALLLTRTWCQQ